MSRMPREYQDLRVSPTRIAHKERSVVGSTFYTFYLEKKQLKMGFQSIFLGFFLWWRGEWNVPKESNSIHIFRWLTVMLGAEANWGRKKYCRAGWHPYLAVPRLWKMCSEPIAAIYISQEQRASLQSVLLICIHIAHGFLEGLSNNPCKIVPKYIIYDTTKSWKDTLT